MRHAGHSACSIVVGVRRPSVQLLLLALIALAGAGMTLPTSSGATRSTRVIVCPQLAGVIIPCCGPPVAQPAQIGPLQPICCPQNALCASSLTIRSSPNPSSADGRVVISGQLLGAPTAGVPVVLWQELPGQSQFHRLLQTTTGATGKYLLMRDAGLDQTNREWYATADGTRSATISQSVEATITLVARLHGRAHRVAFSGRVTPAHKGQRLLLQRRTARGWLTIARPLLSRTSSFHVVHRLATGVHELQAMLPAGADNVTSVSPAVTIHTR